MVIPPEVVAAIGAPYGPAVIPAGTYEGQTAELPTAAVGNFFRTHDGVSEEAAYRITKLLFKNLTALEASHAAAASIKLDSTLTGMPIPLYPGAERYYREIGLIKS